MVNEFDQFVLGAMPHFIAVQYQQVLEAQTPEQKIRHALRVYELGLRALAMGVVSQYLIRDANRVNDPALNQLLLTKLPNATLDIWQKILFGSLRAYEGQRNLFFMPELYDFFWDRSTTPPQYHPGIEAPFTRLTQIRNDLEHGASPVDSAGWQVLCDETLELLHTVLSQFVFFENYDLIRITKRDEDLYWYDCHTGLQVVSAQTPLQTQYDLGPGWFYLSKQNRDFLKLHPLLVFWEEPSLELVVPSAPGDTAVYDRFVQDRLQYLITSLWEQVADEKSVTDFVRLLYYTIEQVKGERQEAERLRWWQLQETARAISKRRMASVLDKYRSDLYLQRNKTKEAFEDFLASDKVCFILTGKSGVGKSNFLLALTEEYGRERSDVCLLMYNGAKLSPEESVTSIVGRDFDNELLLTGRSGEEGIVNIWREMARMDGIEGRRVILFIDAINENDQAKDLLRQIDELVESSPWPWLKVVVTSRPEAWKTIKRGVPLAEARYYREAEKDQLGIEMEPFSYSEKLEPFTRQELPQAYEKYREVYNLQTAYPDLLREVKSVLQDPLALRLIADTYQEQEIPSTLKVGEIYQEYIDHLIKTERLTPEDVRFLEQELMPLMLKEGHYAKAITAQEIDQARTSDGRSLHELIHSEAVLSSGRRVSQSYINLVDAEILIQLGEARDYEIGFKYERFYDYFGGRHLRVLVGDKPELKERADAYRRFINNIRDYPYLWGPVRSALVFDLEEGYDDLITELAQTVDQLTKELIVSVLTAHGRDEPEDVRSLCHQLLQLGQPPRRGGPLSVLRSLWPERKSAQQASAVDMARQFLQATSGSQVHMAKKAAIEVGYNLQLEDVLEQAAYDEASAVRAVAVQYIYYLWRDDQEKGFGILEEVSQQIPGRWVIPNAKAIESCLGVSLMIIFWHYKDLESRSQYFGKLQQIWQGPIEHILSLGEDEGGTKERLKGGLREGILRLVVRLAIAMAGRAEGGVMFSLDELRAFFPPSEQRRQLFERLIPHIDAVHGGARSISIIEDDLVGIMQDRDLFTVYLAFLIILSHVLGEPESALRVVKKLFEIGIESPPPPAIRGASVAAPMIPILVWCIRNLLYGWRFTGVELAQAEISKEALDVMGDFVRRFEDRYGSWCSTEFRQYRYNELSGYTYFYYRAHGDAHSDLLDYLLDKAVEEEDIDALIRHIAGFSGIGTHPAWGVPRASTQALHVILRKIRDTDLEGQLLEENLIAAFSNLRTYHPDVVDDFLAELDDDEMSPEVKRAIQARGATESLGMLLGTAAAWFARDLLIDPNPFMRNMLKWILTQATLCRDFNEWIQLLMKQVIDIAHGKPVFRVPT